MTKAPPKTPRRIIITGRRGKAKKKPTPFEKYQEARKKKPTVPANCLDPSLGEAQDLVYDGWDLYSYDPRGAKECFDEALELDPDLADAYNGLAGLAADKKRFEEAESLYRTAYEKARATSTGPSPSSIGTNVIIRTIARSRTFSSTGGWPFSWRGGSRSRPPGSAT